MDTFMNSVFGNGLVDELFNMLGKAEETETMDNEVKNNSNENETAVMKPQTVEVRPAFEVSENDDKVTMIFEVPGANAGTVDIQVDGRILTVRAESALKSSGRQLIFKRSFHLVDGLDLSKATAKTVDGVLTLELPKAENTKAYKIPVA